MRLSSLSGVGLGKCAVPLRFLLSMISMLIRLFYSNANNEGVGFVGFNKSIDKEINIMCVVNVAFMLVAST